MMKFKIIIILMLCFSKIFAQSVTLTPTGALVPSMTTTARTALTATNGQLVYDTTTNSFWYYNGSDWKEISAGTATNTWTVSGSNIYNNNTSNVGIGTANPINKLDVAGAVVIGSGFAGTVPVPANGAIIQGQVGIGSGPSNTESNLTIGPNSVTEGGQIQLNPGTGFSKAYHIDNWSDNFRIMSGSNYGSESPRFFINSVGNIGIGTTSPSEKLDVSGKTKTTTFQLTNGASNGSILQSDASGNATWVASSTINDNLGNHLATKNLQMGSNYISNDGGSEGISINTNGAVTIQPSVSTDPSLTISTSNTPAYRISQIANGIYPAYQWDMGGNETLFFLKDVSAGSKLPFRVYAGQNTDRLVLRNNNVGVGVNNPSEALEVSGKTKTTTFQMTNGAIGGYVLQSDANGNASWTNPTSLPNGNWTTNGNNQFSALNGYVGIGTVNPSEKLEINGNLKINNGRIHVADSSFTVSLGYNTGINNTGNYNLFVGSLAGESNTTGFYNAFVGAFAGHKNTTGFYNSSLGFGSLENTTTGNSNTAIGHYSSNKNTTGNFNVSLGRRSLENNSTNDFNTAIGYSSLRFSDGGEENTGLGAFSLNNNTTGDYNVGIGLSALTQNTEGDENTAIGYEAGYGNITGDGNVFLGRKAGYFETGSNKLYIANSETPLIYGDFINKNVGIGTSTLPTESNLVIAGNANGEGGQIQLNASTGQSTAYFLDNYINAFRIMSGTNEGSSAVRFFINSSGNVGIGTISPSGKLDVAGSGLVNSNVRSTDNIASITVESPNQNDASLFFSRYDGANSLKRWAWIKANSNETGSNAGGDFVLNRYSDAGAYIGQPILVYRNSGAVVIGNEGTSTTENTFRVNGSIAVKRTVYNANATIAGNDHLIGVTSTGSVTLTLPSASGIAGREYIIKSEASSASITITTTASQKIDGANSKSITTGYGVLRVYSDGANWFTF